MEISQHGRPVDLARILLGVHDTDRTQSKKTTVQPGETHDRVQISDRAKELQRLKAAADRPDGQRDAQVDHIRRSVESGTYRVDGKQVAEAIIRTVLTDSVL